MYGAGFQAWSSRVRSSFSAYLHFQAALYINININININIHINKYIYIYNIYLSLSLSLSLMWLLIYSVEG